MIKIFVKNDFNRQMKISRKFRLNIITKIDYENCFQINFNSKYIFIALSKKFE